MLAPIKKDSGRDGKKPDKDDNDKRDDNGPRRPPVRAKRPGTRPYYALYVNGQHIRVHYLRADEEDWPGELRPGYAVAWVEEKTLRVHCFLFRLGTTVYHTISLIRR